MRTFIKEDPVGNWKSRRQEECLFLGIKGLIFCLFVCFCICFCICFVFSGGGWGGSLIQLTWDQGEPFEPRLQLAFNLNTNTSSHHFFLKARMLIPRDNFYITHFMKSCHRAKTKWRGCSRYLLEVKLSDMAFLSCNLLGMLKKKYDKNLLLVNLYLLVVKMNFNHALKSQNKILVPLRGSFQSFWLAPQVIFLWKPPPLPSPPPKKKQKQKKSRLVNQHSTSCCFPVLTRANRLETAVQGCILTLGLVSILQHQDITRSCHSLPSCSRFSYFELFYLIKQVK